MPFYGKNCTVSAMSVVVDPSLLANIDTTKPVSCAFNLGMDEFLPQQDPIPVPDKENQPPARMVSLQRKRKAGTKADPPSKKGCTTVAEAQKADPKGNRAVSRSVVLLFKVYCNNEWALSNFQK